MQKISTRRLGSITVKFCLLIAIVVSLQSGLLGSYLPGEFWALVTIYLTASVVFHLIRASLISAYRKRNKLKKGERDNFVLGMNSLVELVTFFVTFLAGLWVLDIPFQTFLTSISLVAVALVLIFRDYISNYLDSFRLMFSTDFRLGDYVKVGDKTTGEIADISFRATKLKTDEGDVLYIPNTKFITSEVVNYSKSRFKRIIVPFALPTVSVHPLSEFDKRLTQHLLTEFPDMIRDSKIFLRVTDIKEWHTHFALEAAVDSYDFEVEDRVAKAIYREVLRYQSERPKSEQAMSQAT